ncbi:phosphodiesterase [Psychromonas sp. RZ22]|uniref:sensor domain-containing protein n=1 Tax=Psychromonas algarum TaxID=2555643 RepID=UPI0010681ADE|nr:GGDEF domain-containing phosphodiesterase [Psychromonas sp. RZ22]TEW54457.1 phosphodiesterase [Psychromonas sp. RZ22]
MPNIVEMISIKKNIGVVLIACIASVIILLVHVYLSIQMGLLFSLLVIFIVIISSLFLVSYLAYEKYRLSEQVIRNILHNITDVVAIKDEEGRFTYANKSVSKLYKATESELIGKTDYDFTGNLAQSEAIQENTKAALDKLETIESFESSTDMNTNEVNHYHSIKIPFYNAQKQLRLFIIAKNITDIIKLKEESEKNKARLQNVLDVSEEGLWEWEPQTGRVKHNEQWGNMSGIPFSEESFTEYENCIFKEDKPIVYEALGNLLEKNQPFNIKYRFKRPDGEVIWVWDRGRVAERDKDNNPTLVVGLVLDITQEKYNQQKIHQLAYHDQLTGLSNRVQFEIDLRNTLQQSQQEDTYSALLFLDLDRFKLLNDNYGHHMGDQLLSTIAQTLLNNKQSNEMVARLGGDEFVVILPLIDKDIKCATSYTKNYSNQLIALLSESVSLKNELQDVDIEYAVTVSMGGVIFKSNDNNIFENKILQLADMALYRAKANGGNEAIILDIEAKSDLNYSSELQKTMRNAIDKHEFCIHLQPQYNDLHFIIGAEALVRWEHPTLGLLSPHSFIEMAEESNLIIPIGMQVLKQSCEQLQKWQASASTAHLSISVNLSAKQIWQKLFAEEIIEVVRSYDIDPTKLIVEVTESLFIKDIKDATKKLCKLKSIGISVSLDDFGTGFSSLSYLRDLPIDEIKIDRSFMQDINTDKQALIMVKSIINLANNFNLKVVSEGVEEKEQLDLLKQLGLSIFQGFYFSKPIPPKEMDKLLLDASNNGFL